MFVHDCTYYCQGNIHCISSLAQPNADLALLETELMAFTGQKIKVLRMEPARESEFVEAYLKDPSDWTRRAHDFNLETAIECLVFIEILS